MSSVAGLVPPLGAVQGRIWLLLGCLTAAVLLPSLGVVVWVVASGSSRFADVVYLLLEMLMLQTAAVLVGAAIGAVTSAGIALVAPRAGLPCTAGFRFWAILVCGVSCAAATAMIAAASILAGFR